MTTIAGLEMDALIIPIISGLIGVVSFFIARFFNKAEKVEESSVTQVTHIALIHEKLGTHASSEQKQWQTIDSLVRDVAELKIKIAVFEQRDRRP